MTEYNLENPIETIKFFIINPEVKLLWRCGSGHYAGRKSKIQIKPICYGRSGLSDYNNRYSKPPNIVIGAGYVWFRVEQDAIPINLEAYLLQLEGERNE